jgi:hypothetical protein
MPPLPVPVPRLLVAFFESSERLARHQQGMK